MREFIRHQSGIPIEISPRESVDTLGKQVLLNVSLGGLECLCEKEIKVSTEISISMQILRPVFTAEGKVVWCRETDNQYLVGIQFYGGMDESRLRMVEQVSHIEHYRNEIQMLEGRELDSESAAREWVMKYADFFPQ